MNDGRALEEDVRRIYQTLVDLGGAGVTVEMHKKLTSRSRVLKVDVYFEVKALYGIHRYVIECKDHGRKVEPSDVESFAKVLDHLIGVHQGVMVSRHGFTNGAIKVGEFEDIILLKQDQLEQLALLTNFQAVAFPSDRDIAEPFWAIMGKTANGFDGMPHAVRLPDAPNELVAPLFFSKRTAVEYMKRSFSGNHSSHWGVCGLRQRHLRTVLLLAKMMRGKLGVVFEVPEKADHTIVLVRDAEFIARDYHLDERILDDLDRCPQHSEETIRSMLSK